jgi:hypothetical protein
MSDKHLWHGRPARDGIAQSHAAPADEAQNIGRIPMPHHQFVIQPLGGDHCCHSQLQPTGSMMRPWPSSIHRRAACAVAASNRDLRVWPALLAGAKRDCFPVRIRCVGSAAQLRLSHLSTIAGNRFAVAAVMNHRLPPREPAACTKEPCEHRSLPSSASRRWQRIWLC